MKDKITKDATLAEVLRKEGSEEILARYNLPCLNCPFAKFEMDKLKIGKICENYNIDIKNLLKELNK